VNWKVASGARLPPQVAPPIRLGAPLVVPLADTGRLLPRLVPGQPAAGVAEAVGLRVATAVAVGVGVDVLERVLLGPALGVLVTCGAGVFVGGRIVLVEAGLAVPVGVAVEVLAGDGLGLFVAGSVAVLVGTALAVLVATGLAVVVGIGLAVLVGRGLALLVGSGLAVLVGKGLAVLVGVTPGRQPVKSTTSCGRIVASVLSSDPNVNSMASAPSAESLSNQPKFERVPLTKPATSPVTFQCKTAPTARPVTAVLVAAATASPPGTDHDVEAVAFNHVAPLVDAPVPSFQTVVSACASYVRAATSAEATVI